MKRIEPADVDEGQYHANLSDLSACRVQHIYIHPMLVYCCYFLRAFIIHGLSRAFF
jgi:hypothetical protein